ncbi:MAG: hypothetical protein AB7H97_19890 [Pseudobdellovibrionaceae bacterium]
MEPITAQEKQSQVSHSTIQDTQSGYCPLEAKKLRRKKRRISSLDPNVNWEDIKGADEEN